MPSNSTDMGSVVVRVSLAEKTGYLCIEVEDTGKGISESDKEQLFQSFGQGDLSVTSPLWWNGFGFSYLKAVDTIDGWPDWFFIDNRSENIANAGATFGLRCPWVWMKVRLMMPYLSLQSCCTHPCNFWFD